MKDEASDIKTQVQAHAERLALVARQYFGSGDAGPNQIGELTEGFAEALEKLVASGKSIDQAYEEIFDRIAHGVDDG
ncbi:MAG: hypothetical protein NXH72_03920 [Hyphomonadaceae bacterium]|nr:hypothetical protein [Hyphomonadaceae bacterium]